MTQSVKGITWVVDFLSTVDALQDREKITKFLVETPRKVGLQAIPETLVIYAGEHWSGWTGVIVLQESHLAIHTWPEAVYGHVELSSCKATGKVGEGLLEALRATFPAFAVIRMHKVDWDNG